MSSGARRIAFVGLAKNTGKTTALVESLAGFHERAVLAGATSAGRDGEEYDSLTGEPKPRFRLWKGQLVASAESTFVPGTADRLSRLSLATRFGSIEVRRMTQHAAMEVIGPATASEVALACSALEEAGSRLVVIDGAFGRRAFASARVADGIVLSVGISAGGSLEAAVQRARSAAELISLPAPPPDRPARFFSGAVTDAELESNPPGDRDLLVAEDFASIFLSERRRRELAAQSVTLAVRRPARLLAVTANPTAPGRPPVPADRFVDALFREIPSVPLFDLCADLSLGA